MTDLFTPFSTLRTFTNQEQENYVSGWSVQIDVNDIYALLKNAPNLVALELCDANAFAVLRYLASDAQKPESTKLDKLRLLCLQYRP